jgi:hypothetical protein
MLCSGLNVYVTTPLVAGCYQDSDPKYVQSNFNTFGKEEYDSDLRNDEVFSQEEIQACSSPGEFSLKGAFDIRLSELVQHPEKKTYPVMFHDIDGLFEKKWVEELLGEKLVDINTEIPIVLYQRPYCEKLKETLRTWPAFTLLHLSDEDGRDPIDIYTWPACKGVVRNYFRRDLQAQSQVVTIPLGYHWRPSDAGGGKGHTKNLVWSFIGAEHGGRTAKLQPFKGIEPYKCVFLSGWNSPEKRGEDEVVDTLLRSLCVPCPGGINIETFRLYEALEAGCVPIMVEEAGSADYLAYLKRFIPLATSTDWSTAARVTHGLSKDMKLYREYRKSLMVGWASMKAWASSEARRVLLQTRQVKV